MYNMPPAIIALGNCTLPITKTKITDSIPTYINNTYKNKYINANKCK